MYLTIFTLGNVKGILVVYFICKQYGTNAFFGFVNLVSLNTFSHEHVSNYNDEIYQILLFLSLCCCLFGLPLVTHWSMMCCKNIFLILAEWWVTSMTFTLLVTAQGESTLSLRECAVDQYSAEGMHFADSLHARCIDNPL